MGITLLLQFCHGTTANRLQLSSLADGRGFQTTADGTPIYPHGMGRTIRRGGGGGRSGGGGKVVALLPPRRGVVASLGRLPMACMRARTKQRSSSPWSRRRCGGCSGHRRRQIRQRPVAGREIAWKWKERRPRSPHGKGKSGGEGRRSWSGSGSRRKQTWLQRSRYRWERRRMTRTRTTTTMRAW